MRCRYCQLEKVMTKEHIIPKFIYKFLQSAKLPVIGWNERAQKSIGGEATIADVCKECNGGPLSSLDAYGQSFLVDNGLLTKVFLKENTIIKYDYDRLLRWLLKVSYNSLTSKNDPSVVFFEKHIDFILNGSPAPDKGSITLFVGLTSPVKVPDEFRDKYPTLVSEKNLFGPFSFGINESIKPYLKYNIAVTGITIGSLFFHIALFDNPLWSKSLFIKRTSINGQMKVVNPVSSAMSISTCNRTWLQRASRQKYKEQKANLSNKK